MTHIPFIPRLRVAALALAAAACLGTAPTATLAQTAGAAAGSAAAGVNRSANRSADFIVAVVNTEAVTAVEVAQRIERLSAEAKRAGGPQPNADALRQQVLDALIDERVQITFAREVGQKVDDADIDRAVANVAAQNQITVPQLRDRMRAEGMAMPRFRSNLRDQLMLERVREREVNARIRVSDADIDKLLDEYRAKASTESQLNLAQILITVPENASTELLAQRQARADQALARVRAGEDFSKVARDLSEDGNREAGGEIGMRPAGRLPDLFVDAVRGLAVGQVSAQPLRSPAGFHLLKLLDRQDSNAFQITQTRARHILLRSTDKTQAAAVLRRMDDLRRQIERGAKKFEDLAREVSEDGSASSGGDLGWASPGQFVPEFEEAMVKLAPGGISPPVVSRFGVHLIQVLERRNITPDPKEIRDQARAQLRESKFDQAYADWAKELRLRAYIELREPPQ
jgi:peptidyl-prolyl cis-trans isomerase SurA